MAKLVAQRAWAVAYDPQYFLQMAEEYDDDRLQQLNEHLAQGDYVVVSDDPQGFPGDLVVDFSLDLENPYRALILLKR